MVYFNNKKWYTGVCIYVTEVNVWNIKNLFWFAYRPQEVQHEKAQGNSFT